MNLLTPVFALLACAHAASPNPSKSVNVMADPAVREFRTCPLSGISFRTADDGWLFSKCGEIFRSKTGGKSWRRDDQTAFQLFETPLPASGNQERLDDRVQGSFAHGHLNFMRWFSPSEGIAGGYGGWQFFRTTDAGKTWTAVDLPSNQRLSSVTQRDDFVWTCGSSGVILRSADRGRSWQRTQSPFNSDDQCKRLKVDGLHGLSALGTKGSAWASSDDGMTWTPNPRSHVADAGQAAQPDALGQGDVEIVGMNLRITDGDQPPLVQPVLTEGKGVLEKLTSVDDVGTSKYGMSGRHFYFAEDGHTWYVRSDLPAKPRRATWLSDRTIILETNEGVFQSNDGGREWRLSSQPEIDLADAARARGEASPGEFNPLRCLLDEPGGHLHIDLGTQGCFGGSINTLDLTVTGALGRLSGQMQFARQTHALADVPVTLQEAHDVIAELGAAITQRELPSGCTSTTAFQSTITFHCGADLVAANQVLTFTTHNCGGRMMDGVGGSTSFSTSHERGYARALGVFEASEAVLQRHCVK